MAIELSGCAILNDRKEILLLFKKNMQHYEFPGGKVEQNESLEETAKRECLEEIGVNIEIIKYLGYESFSIKGNDFISHIFLAKIKKNEKPFVKEKEKFSKLIWMPLKDYKKYVLAPNVRSFCERYEQSFVEL